MLLAEVSVEEVGVLVPVIGDDVMHAGTDVVGNEASGVGGGVDRGHGGGGEGGFAQNLVDAGGADGGEEFAFGDRTTSRPRRRLRRAGGEPTRRARATCF